MHMAACGSCGKFFRVRTLCEDKHRCKLNNDGKFEHQVQEWIKPLLLSSSKRETKHEDKQKRSRDAAVKKYLALS